MKKERRWNQNVVNWLLIFAVWTMVALFLTTQIVTQSRAVGQPLPFLRALSWQMSSGYLMLALVPLILWLGRRFRFEKGQWKRSIVVHLIASVLVALLHQSVDALILPSLGYPGRPFDSYLETYKFFLMLNLHLNVTIYWLVLGVQNAIGYYQMYRDRELRASQLEARLAQSRLQILKMQLHPHFLFNTLNTISELIYKDPETAEQMTTNLSDLLRLSLESVGVQEVTLQQEIEFLNKYLEIEQTRFHDRLQVQMQIDPAALDAGVPNMILQPLVENAIRHGIAPRASGGSIEISAARHNGSVQLTVSDDGLGLPNGDTSSIREGVGLSNTRARLTHLYGDAHQFELQRRAGSGLTLHLTIPYRSVLVNDPHDHEDSDADRG